MHAGVIDVLTEALKAKNERVRRRIMATLGELLFYVATQQQVYTCPTHFSNAIFSDLAPHVLLQQQQGTAFAPGLSRSTCSVAAPLCGFMAAGTNQSDDNVLACWPDQAHMRSRSWNRHHVSSDKSQLPFVPLLILCC